MVEAGLYVNDGAADDPDGWQGLVTLLHGRFRVRTTERSTGFRGRIEWARSNSFRLVSWSADPELLMRGRRELKQDPLPMFELVAPIAGQARLVAGNSTALLDPGDMALVNLNRSVSTEHSTRCAALGFVVPDNEILSRVSRGSDFTVIDRRVGLGNVAFHALTALSGEARAVDATAFDSAAARILELLLLASRSSQDVPQDSSRLIEDAVRDYVRRHIRDPDLTGRAIGEALGWSLRRIQQVLQQADTTPSELIRTERLRMARETLCDPRLADLPVYRVAHEHGFSGQSAFSRAFRAEYGVSPSEMRAVVAREV